MAEENFDVLEEDPGHAFAIEMGLEFDEFCVEQLEKELSAGEPLLIPDDEMDTLWVCLHDCSMHEADTCYQFSINLGDELDDADPDMVEDSEVPIPEAPEISAARELMDNDEDETAPDIFQIVKSCLKDI